MPAGTISVHDAGADGDRRRRRERVASGAAHPSCWSPATTSIAVEMHQQSATSTDVGFDLELRATEAPGRAADRDACASPAERRSINTARHVRRRRDGAGRALRRDALRRRPAADGVVHRPGSGAGRTDHRRYADDAQRSGASINVDGQTPHAHGLMKFPTLVGGARPGAGRRGHHLGDAADQLHRPRPHDAGLPADPGLGRRQATWNQRATGVAWGSAGADGAASNARRAVSARLHDHRTAVGRSHAVRPGVEQRRAELRRRVHRLRHRRRRLRQQRVGHFAGPERHLPRSARHRSTTQSLSRHERHVDFPATSPSA